MNVPQKPTHATHTLNVPILMRHIHVHVKQVMLEMAKCALTSTNVLKKVLVTLMLRVPTLLVRMFALATQVTMAMARHALIPTNVRVSTPAMRLLLLAQTPSVHTNVPAMMDM
jgi:hypothetical protein